MIGHTQPMRGLLLTSLLLALIGCQPNSPEPAATAEAPAAAPAAKTKVTVYSPHGREMLEPFERRLEVAHPEIDLEWLDMGSQDILDRLRAEQASPACDVWWGAPHTMFIKGAKEGLLAPYRPTWAEAIDVGRKDPDDLWYGQYLTPGVIVYNTEALTGDQAPQDWDGLLEPQWQDKILIRDPLGSGTMRTFIAAMILRAPSEEAGFDWLRRLDANTKSYPASPALLHRQLATQEGLITVWNLRDVDIQHRVNGYPLGYVIPKSGCPLVTDAIALVRGGPNPEGAKVFYEYVTSDEQLLWAAEEFDCLPARTDIDQTKLPERLPREIPELKLDWAEVEANGERWMKTWDEQVRGRG